MLEQITGLDKNHRIVKQQIILVVSGFLLAFFILGLAANIMLNNQQENYNKLDYLVNQSNAKSNAMTKLSDSIRDRMLIIYDILNTDDVFEIDEMNMKFSGKATDFLEAREELMSLDLTQSQIDELVDQRKILKKAQVALGTIVNNAMNEIANNGVELINEARDINAGVLDRLNNMRKVQTDLAKKNLSSARSSYEETRQKMFLLGAAGVIFSLLIIYFVIRQIRSQGLMLSSLMQQLEQANSTLESKVEKRTKQLLHTREENMRMGAELDISRQIQSVILPTDEEVAAVPGLDIAAFMEPADEIGGDYYEVLKHDNGALIGIGDVTGHGLESGIVMLMTQSIIRAQSNIDSKNVVGMLQVANKTIHDNVARMNCEKNLTLMLLDYRLINNESTSNVQSEVAELNISGQHESVLIVRNNGDLEEIDTDELGFPVGLIDDADEFYHQHKITLFKGDTVVLYTDGITEAANTEHELYGIERLRAIIRQHHQNPPEHIKEQVIQHVKDHIGEQKVYDDLTLLVLQQK